MKQSWSDEAPLGDCDMKNIGNSVLKNQTFTSTKLKITNEYENKISLYTMSNHVTKHS